MPQFPHALIGCCLIAAATGCQSMLQQTTTDVPAAETVAVQIRPAHSKRKTIEVPLKPNMTLQDVVEASKVKFRKRKAYIVRTSPITGDSHKLLATFGTKRRVTMETDYAVQPGDRIVIEQDTQSSVEKVMLEVLGRT